jgi:phage-related minor tail protein
LTNIDGRLSLLRTNSPSSYKILDDGLALQTAISSKLAANAGQTIAKSSGLLKESLNFPSNVLEGVNTLEAGAASYVSDLMTSSDYASGIQTAVKHIMTKDQDMATAF